MKIIELLDSSTPSSHEKKPDSPKDVVVINEIIIEYLNWIGYKHTSTVFKSGKFIYIILFIVLLKYNK